MFIVIEFIITVVEIIITIATNISISIIAFVKLVSFYFIYTYIK